MAGKPCNPGGTTAALPVDMNAPGCLPVRFRRAPADQVGVEHEHGTMRSKPARAYYLDGLTAPFQSGVSLPGTLRVDQNFSGAEVVLLYPGPNSVEVLGILNRFPELKCLHIIESAEANLDAIRSELQTEIGHRQLPKLAG